MNVCSALWLCLAACGIFPAAVYGASPTSSNEITDAAQIWMLPPVGRSVPHQIRIEGRVDYVDAAWKLLWIGNGNHGTFIQLADTPPRLEAGQFVRIEGTLVPDEGLSARRVQVSVLRAQEPVEPAGATGRINDLARLDSRVVSVDAFVDGIQLIDAQHLRLYLVVDDRMIIGWVKPDNPDRLPDLAGRTIRAVGLYSMRLDPTRTNATIELWINRESDIVVTGTIAAMPAFVSSITPVADIVQRPAGGWVHVRGRVEARVPGRRIVVRDETGEIAVESVQRQPPPQGAEVEAVGRVAHAEGRWRLVSGLVRAVSEAPTKRTPDGVLSSVAEVRTLSPADADKRIPVRIAGVVTWSLPEADFFFLQDVTGGVRVRFPRSTMPSPPLCKFMEVTGVTRSDPTGVTEIELQSFRDMGAMNAPVPKVITLAQAMTGREDGQWVEMQGFVQRVVSEGDWRWIHLTSPEGDFVGHLQSPVNFVANPGSLVRLQGVCETVRSPSGDVQLVRLRIPFLHSITIDDDAPADPFDLPPQTIASIDPLAMSGGLRRARVSGIVTLSRPSEHLLTIQDNGRGLMVLTRDAVDMNLGSRIEVVGIIGNEGERALLRQSSVRLLGGAGLPEPLDVPIPEVPLRSLDERLITVQGRLLDVFRSPTDVRLRLLKGDFLFEVVLPRPFASAALPEIGSDLRLTGIYKADYDDSRHLRGFHVDLRSPSDIAVVHPPRLWTLRRALIAAAVLAVISLLSSVWVFALRRRVRRQTDQIRTQMEHQARLEASIQHAARLESLGLLAGGIAHDFNNLLTIIIGNLGLAMMSESAVAEVGSNLQEARRGASRAQELTRQLLTFAKGGMPQRGPTPLDDLVKDAVGSVIRLASGPIDVAYDFASDSRPALGDRPQLLQAIQNLALNAIQAMPRGGRLGIALRNVEMSDGNDHALASGRYLELVLEDSGEGISPENLSKVFDPYFTTRKTGSGLGLTAAYSIVRKHGGAIEIASTKGRGTTVSLWIPAASEMLLEPPPAPISETEDTGRKGRPRILLMDDEDSIRLIGSAYLKRKGYEVVVAADGESAVRMFKEARTSGNSFDLIILDLTVPGGMGGREAIERIRSDDRSVPAIVSSGYSSDPVMADYQKYGFDGCVPKPYELDQLIDAIRRLTERRTT